MKLKFEIPDADAPGFLLRQRKLSDYLACPDGDPEKWVKMVDLMLDYVVLPKSRADAEKAIWELSQNEYSSVMEQISKKGEVDPNT
jgi:hypothetical protein